MRLLDEGPRPERSIALLPDAFRSMNEESCEQLKADMSLERFEKGDVLQKEGDVARTLTVLATGWVRESLSGQVVGVLGPGTLQAIPLRNSGLHSVTLTALAPLMALRFTHTVLRATLLSNPSVLAEVSDRHYQRLIHSQKLMRNMAQFALDVRIEQFLWETGTPQPDGSRLVPPALGQQLLADLFQTTRERVSKQRKLLVTAGRLTKRGSDWHVVRPFFAVESPQRSFLSGAPPATPSREAPG